MCAALSDDGLLLHRPLIGLYNTERLFSLLDDLHIRLVPEEDRRRGASNSPTFVAVWDNVAFPNPAAVTDWFASHPRMLVLFLPPYSPFLNPIEEFSLRGGGRFMTTMTRCLYWRQWMLSHLFCGSARKICSTWPLHIWCTERTFENVLYLSLLQCE